MPSFTVQVSNLQQVGPNVEVRLAVGEDLEGVLRERGEDVPAPIEVVAQIDTGASGTAIRADLRLSYSCSRLAP